MDLGFTKSKQRIGERFRIFRLLMLRTRKRLALLSGINEGYLEIFERGIVLPEPVLLAIFSRAFGLNLTWLIFGEEEIFYKRVPGVPLFAYEVDRMEYYKTGEFRGLFQILEKISAFDLDPEEIENIATLRELLEEYENLETYSMDRKIICMPESIPLI